ncbi:MAG TPA: hypothetical protein VGQ83_33680 [Polyangia bacterium]|jgi:hypothetical protein
MRWAFVGLALVATACGSEPPETVVPYPPPVAVPGDADGAVYIVSNASGELTPGAGVGYSITYETGGHWHVRWTCDSLVTGYICNFDGAVSAAAGDLITALAPIPAEAADSVWLEPDGTALGFSAVATTAVDGFDFDAPAGHKVSIDVLVDGAYHLEFVIFPSGDPALGDIFAASPRVLPVVLQPTLE